MKKLYLLGHPVSHSLSPAMQNAAIRHYGLDWHYETLDVAPEDLPAKLKELEDDEDVVGCNVTVPHKVAVYEWLGEEMCAFEARKARAVNTLFRDDAGHFRGNSTDFAGSIQALMNEAFPGHAIDGLLKEWDVAVLGTGGSAQTLALCMGGTDRGTPISIPHVLFTPKSITVFGRSVEKATNLVGKIPTLIQGEADRERLTVVGRPLSQFADWNHKRKSLVFQTTTVGLASGENPGDSPVPSGSVHAGQIAFDLVYKPHDTPFLVDAAKHGATIVHGINMLVGQGALSFQRWINASADRKIDLFETVSVMRSALGA